MNKNQQQCKLHKLYKMKLIKHYLYYLTIFVILLILILRRFLKINISKEFLETYSDLDIILNISTITLFAFLIWVTISKRQNTVGFSNKFINVKSIFTFYAEKHYYTPLKIFDQIIFNKLKFYFNIERMLVINKILYHIYIILHANNFSFFNKYYIIYMLSKYLPKIIVLFCFLLDVFYYTRFYYFYISLPLLLIPLIMQYIKYMIFKEFHSICKKLEDTLEIFDIIPGTPDDLVPLISIPDYLKKNCIIRIENKENPYQHYGLTLSFYYRQPVEEKDKNLDYNYAIEHYTKYLRHIEIINVIYTLLINLEHKFDKNLNLLIFFSYFMGWFYIVTNLIFLKYTYDISIVINETNPFNE